MIFAAGSFLLAVLLIILFFARRAAIKQSLLESLRFKLLLVRVPQKQPEQGTDLREEINKSAQLYSLLSGSKLPFALEAAVPHIGEEIHFYISVPSNSIPSVKRQIEGLFADAQVEESEEYNIFNPAGVAVGFYLKQKSYYAFPIRTYAETNIDTFAPILSGLSNLAEVGEGMALQVVARPANPSRKKNIMRAISDLRRGESLEKVSVATGGFGLKDISAALNPQGKKKETEAQPKVVDEEAIKTLESKISQPLFEVNFRIVASAGDYAAAESLALAVADSFSQFQAPRRGELAAVKAGRPNDFLFSYSFRQFDESQSLVLNAAELASIFHLPTATIGVQKIKWLKGKEAPAPANLPTSGVVLGENAFRGEKKTIMFSEDDRRRHLYIIGQTGTGKSALLKNMAVNDLRNGKGLAIIDPHGDLAEGIMALAPKERYDDMIVLDPSDIDRPVGLNMLEYNLARPEEKTFIVNEMQGIFNKLFPPETMGPMFEQYMKNALLLLMEDMHNEPATLMEVPRVFTDAEYRERKLKRITNPAVIDFWEKEAVRAGGEAALANITPYITSKFNNFTANDYIRPIIGQVESAFNFREIIDQGKVLVVNLAKGRIGDINANLLGMVIVGKLLMAALSRVDISDESQRKDFYLYIDEFHNFTTDSIAVILSEARKYRLNLIIAHQFIAQLTERIKDAVFGNVGSKIAFRVGVPDAEELAKEFEPTFSKSDLINIDNYNAYAKMLIGGQPAKPFNIKTLPPQAGSAEAAKTVREVSRLKYGRQRSVIEEDIFKRLRG
ncbi:MAG: type IV secretion system DNA-binding domain-containing protein [Patescibacteria group bacterium]|nr:type IV secretion system DNA-binding domain-containing protein [Patescibacteria group bacterium]